MPETLAIRPADLQIDEENPRISEPNAGQNKALQALASLLGRKLQVLAEDITANGLNPADLPIVMPSAGDSTRYVVLEGNRRLVALKALENPDSLGDSVERFVLKQIRRLSHGYQSNPVEMVNCLVVKGREEARHWIELRHTGENDGAGILRWGSDEAARFKARSEGRRAEPHTQALDFLQRRGTLDAAVRSRVPATSFKRLLGTPEVREKLGVDVQGGVLTLLADERRVAKALMHVINDLVSGKTRVAHIYERKDRIGYANTLPAEIAVTATVPPGQGVPASASLPTSTQKIAVGGVRSRRRERERLIGRDCVLNIPPGRIRDIEHELRRLNLEEYTNAVSVLFRVFVELSVDDYMDRNRLPWTEKDLLRVKMESVATDLEGKKKISRMQAKAVRHSCKTDSLLVPGVWTMNGYVHNQWVFPAPADLRAHFDSLQPFIAAMWTP